MLRIALTLFIVSGSLMCAISQKEGDQWVIGYYAEGSPEHSVMYIDFRGDELNVSLKFNFTMTLTETVSNICNASGDPVIWTNGMEIFGSDGVYIVDTIAYDGQWAYWQHFYGVNQEKPLGFPYTDGAIILTVPNTDETYSVIYHSAERSEFGYAVSRFLEARISILENSAYEIQFQDSLIGTHHQWYNNQIEAVRHANGRDWWIVKFERNTGKYFSFILDPNGIQFSHIGETGNTVNFGTGGQATFSPFGNYYARMDFQSYEEGQYLTLYSFDRCTGDFEHIETLSTESGLFTGPAFSPSERYLYGNNNTHLWQWDLWQEDISASQTLVDTFDGFVQPGWFETYFGLQVLAPDGRIYMIPAGGSSEYMHVIDRPDLPAEDCNFLQHHINLTVPNGMSAPNIPNFRLGPLDGSPCDTLGIDNIPVSRWRYEEDQPGWYHQIRFTDLSFYNPQTWYWDFGDGETSDEQSPIHDFEDGLYHVCLTVSNENGADSTCQWIEILPTATHDAPDRETDLSITPNPFDTELTVVSESGIFRAASFHLFDMYGRLVLHQPELPIPLKMTLPSLPSGMYLCRIEEEDGTVYSFKLMRQ